MNPARPTVIAGVVVLDSPPAQPIPAKAYVKEHFRARIDRFSDALAAERTVSRLFANDFPVDYSRLSRALLLFSGADTKFFLRANVDSISLVMPLGSLVYGLECSNWTAK